MPKFFYLKFYLLLIILTANNLPAAFSFTGINNSPDSFNSKYVDQQDIAGQLAFSSSNLPIIVINTNGQTVAKDVKITAHMGIIYNGPNQRNNLTDPYNHYNGDIRIELRGNMTLNFEKKPFNLETKDVNGDNLNVPCLVCQKKMIGYCPHLI